MSIKATLKTFLGLEHRASDGYSNAAVDALLGSALGNVGQPSATAAVQTCVRAIADPFATATVSGAPMPISASFLVDLARRLLLGGNALYLIDLDRLGAIILRPASAFTFGGNPSRLSYELELPNPNQQGQPLIRRVPAEGVVHVKINAPSSEPWLGRAPWQCAQLTAEALGQIERSLKADSSIPTGLLLPVPDGISNAAKDGIRNALARGKGAITPVETTAGGYGQGRLAAPRNDYDQKRFGPAIPETSLGMRDRTAVQILRSYGLSEAIWGDGNAQLQARRSLYLDVIIPLASVIAEELGAKLGAKVGAIIDPPP